MVHVRMPDELKEKLTASAKYNSRTVTTEIINRLNESYRFESMTAAEPRLKKPYSDLFESLEQIRQMIDEKKESELL